MRFHYPVRVSALAAGLVAAISTAGPAMAGSVSSSDAWSGDYASMALPAGTVLVLDYVGYPSNNGFIDTNGNNIAGSKADIWSNIARVSYFTRLGDMPLILEAALPYARVDNASIGGVPQTTHAGFFSPVLFQTLGLIANPREQRFLGLTSYEYLPAGDYDASAQINVATPKQFVWVPQIGYSEGLGKMAPGLKGFWFDLIANASFHSNGSNVANGPTEFPTPFGLLPGTFAYGTLKEDTSYDLKVFLRYDIMPLSHVSVGLEKSWGGLQTLTNGSGVIPTPFGPINTAIPNQAIGKDDYLRGHFQATMPLANDFQVGLDVSHDFERTGGYREALGAEVRFTKFFWPGGAPPH
jgi:outer membrane putative beta-barrel porin/alpha-amylase